MFVIALFMFIFILFALFFLYFWGINPGDMTVFLTADQSFTFPTPIFLIAAVLIGLLLGNGLHFLAILLRSFTDWRGNRQQKRNEETLNIYRKGVGRLLSGDLKQARNLLEKAQNREPKKVDILLALTNVAEQEGDFDRALKILAQARETDPQGIEVLFKLASVLQKLERTTDAIEVYRSLIADNANNRKALRALRDLLIDQDNWKEAQTLQARILKAAAKGGKIDSERQLMLQIRYQIAAMDLEEGHIDTAIKSLSDLCREQQVATPARVSLGDAYLKKGDIPRAAETYQMGYCDSKRAVFLERLEECYMQQEDPSSLLNFYREQLNKDDKDLLLRLYFGRFCLRIEMVDEAINQLHVVESAGTDFPQLHLLLAEANRRRDQVELSMNEYRRALQIDGHLQLGFVCETCQVSSAKWHSRCPHCGGFDQLKLPAREEILSARPQEQKAIPHGQREPEHG